MACRCRNSSVYDYLDKLTATVVSTSSSILQNGRTGRTAALSSSFSIVSVAHGGRLAQWRRLGGKAGSPVDASRGPLLLQLRPEFFPFLTFSCHVSSYFVMILCGGCVSGSKVKLPTVKTFHGLEENPHILGLSKTASISASRPKC